REGLIIDKVDGERSPASHREAVGEAAGNEIWTVVPGPSRGNSTAAFPPHSASSLSFRLRKPWPFGRSTSLGNPVPESQMRSTRRPFAWHALTRISLPPYFTLFSTRVCRLKGGTCSRINS